MGARLVAEKHVVVVGAGVVGLCTAEALVKKGVRVTILDQDRQLADGCSFGNGGMIVPSHFVPLAAPGMMMMGLKMMARRDSPFGISNPLDPVIAGWLLKFMAAANKTRAERAGPLLRDLNLASRELYSQYSFEFPLHQRGLLMLCKTEAALHAEEHLARDANQLGLTAKILNANELGKVEPGIRMDVAGGVLFEDDGHLHPGSFMQALEQHLRESGVSLRLGEPVTGFQTSNGKVHAVSTSKGEIACDEVVLAAGAWSSPLAAKLGLQLPLLAGKGYGFTVPNPVEQPSIPSILTEGRIAVTPMPDGLRFVGTLELSRPSLKQSPARVEGIRRSIPEFYPAFRGQKCPDKVWCGLRPCSPDGLPYLGRTKKAANVFIAAGHAMMGMSLGPISGKIIADLVTGGPLSTSIDLLDPDRYA